MGQDGSESFLGSRYTLLEEIGAGGMGTVWRARERDTGDVVAVKLLRDGLAGDADLVLRFVQERNVMRALRHPNIVTVRDFVIEGDRLALVMDLVEGGDLRGLLRRRGTLPPGEAARLLAGIAAALAAAHAAGVAHRDVKPGNVLIDAGTGRARLTDFGVARIVHGPGLTQTSSIIGTPAYLAPEIAGGDAATPAVDVYALGLILYELLAGRPPFVGEHPMALLRQHASSMPRRLPGMPDALWQVIVACVAKEPGARPEAAAVARALAEAAPSLAGHPALPPIPRTDSPSTTSEPLPSSASGPLAALPAPSEPLPPISSPSGAPSASGVPGPPVPSGAPALTGAPGSPGTRAAAGTGGDRSRAVTGVSGRRPRRPLAVVAATVAALALTGTAVAVVAPWRGPDPKGAADAEAALDAVPPPVTTAITPENGSMRALKSPTASVRTPRTTTPATPARRPSTDPPRKTVRTPRAAASPSVTEDPVEEGRPAEPSRQPATAPQWQCRSWGRAADGVEMSPCVALVGDVFHLQGRLRGANAAGSDIHVQLYDTDGDTNVSAPFTCADVAPTGAGGVATCGPFQVRIPQGGAKIDVRQRWRRTGTGTFGGGLESPWVLW
ncbi:Serine/threonine-protein kinase PrkC [Nonomuraea coxensis DSM 45129]|uniref:non-specific serine/threonine protein kinase n=1 Tax=Nonomuraea coxensis DSM 45129 TaxID=1122611 RepID=A0ABX8U9C3_9ACTN|nr:serine/threonine-protein kinase [Nonomuraea coxensis]QYC44135.1 Serine/threonine-protein kinase PrkC [Nonomuraea coxensis DSM 45129]